MVWHAPTHYEILGVTRVATKDEIRSAYIIKARAEHPDAGGEADMFARAAQAYKVLTNNDKRKEYDSWLNDNFKVCSSCHGRGVIFKQQSIKERTSVRCSKCRGGGVEL